MLNLKETLRVEKQIKPESGNTSSSSGLETLKAVRLLAVNIKNPYSTYRSFQSISPSSWSVLMNTVPMVSLVRRRIISAGTRCPYTDRKSQIYAVPTTFLQQMCASHYLRSLTLSTSQYSRQTYVTIETRAVSSV